MTPTQWEALAVAVARYVGSAWDGAVLGATPLPLAAGPVVAAFGRHHRPDPRSARAIALLRHAVDEAGLLELAFAAADEAGSWALLVDGEAPARATPGRLAAAELLAAFLGAAAREAWRLAGLVSGPQGGMA